MTPWWRARTLRERLVLAVGVVLLAGMLLHVLWWQPLSRETAALRDAVERLERDLEWMEHAAAQIRTAAVRSGLPAPAAQTAGSLVTVVDQAARGAGLGRALMQLDPQGADKVRIRLEGAAFDVLLAWVATLEQEAGIRVESATVEPASGPGSVDVRMVLVGGGA